MMIKKQTLAGLIVATIVATSSGNALAGPSYDSADTRALVESMVEAHGGLDSWMEAPSFSYKYAMYLVSLPVGGDTGRNHSDSWRLYEATLEPRTSRGYLTLPMEDSTGPHAGFDGENLWRTPYDFDPSFQDPPFQLMYYHFAMISLPWVTQLDGVVLEDLGLRKLPTREAELHAVRMSFSPEGKTHGGHYDLYIDPQTKRLTGWIGTTQVPMMPGDFLPAKMEGTDGPGRIARIVDQHAEIDGRVIPISYSSVATDGSDRLFGVHLLMEASFVETFDESMIRPPENAEVVYQVEH